MDSVGLLIFPTAYVAEAESPPPLPVTTVKPYAVAEEEWGPTRRGRTATFVAFLTNNNALQFAAMSGYRVDPIPWRGTADEAPA